MTSVWAKAIVSVFVVCILLAGSDSAYPQDKKDVKLTDEQIKKNKALVAATWKCDIPTIKALLKDGADPNWQNPDDLGKTALIRSIFTHKLEVTKVLIENGADVHVPAASGQKRYPILYAGVIGTIETAQYLLSKGGDKDVNHEAGMLGSLCAHGDSPAEMITLMVKAGADPNILYDRAVPLVAAIKRGRPDYVKALIAAKADVNWKDKMGKSVLRYAVEKGNMEITALLKEAGVKETPPPQPPPAPPANKATPNDFKPGAARVLPQAKAAETERGTNPKEKPAKGEPPGPEDPRLATVVAVLNKYCVGCHGGEKPKGELTLEKLTPDFATHGEKWQEVLARLTNHSMPPSDKSQPTATEAKVVTEWITAGLTAQQRQRFSTQGRALVRRLNRNEYSNTINDLLGIERDLRELLPEDGTAHGFDTGDMALDLSTNHLERYMLAANLALEVAFSHTPTTTQRYVLNAAEQAKKPSHPLYLLHACCAEEERMIFFGPQYVKRQLGYFGGQFKDQFGRVAQAGRYRYRIRASSFQDPDQIVSMIVYAGECRLGSQNRFVGNFDLAAEPAAVEFTVFQNPGDTLRFEPYGAPRTSYGIPKPKSGKGKPEDWTTPGLAVYWIEVEGPLSEGRLVSREMLDRGTLADSEAILRRFLPRAFRRPVNQDEIEPYVAMVRARLAKGSTFREALQVALTAVLCSPDFLYLRTTPGRLNDFELASRLSYFLWSTLPDDTLADLAAQGQLGRPDVLRAQVERLLKAPRAHAFTENFTGQWLNLRDLWANTPDPIFFGMGEAAHGAWDDFLIHSMLQETHLFFEEIFGNDRSLLEFVHSDWSIFNRRLAEHYGIPGLQGQRFRKVILPADSHRGGVMTQASVLKVTANGLTTSPIQRGVWVLERLMGQSPPPPPKNVEAPEPDIRGATTIREQLAKHRVGSCASCHRAIDPPGFALESFDPIGRWRDRYRTTKTHWKGRENGPLVDCSDELPGGKKFKNIDEFKRMLLEDKESIARCLAEKLLVYGTGHQVELADREEIEHIVERLKTKHYGFRSLIQEVVLSELFRSK